MCLASSCLWAQEEDPPFSTGDTDVGYIDSALPMNQIRFRFDSAYDNPIPDRAEFFYRAAVTPGGVLADGQTWESNLDYRDISAYLEYRLCANASVFIDTAYRFLEPDRNEPSNGFGDLQIGLKRVLWSRPNDMLTAQLRTYLPTGDADERLGTDHVSFEPGLLYLGRINRRTRVEGELRLWIPIDTSEAANGQDFSGEVLRYGVGVSHDLFDETTNSPRITTVTEIVGWSIFDGFGTISDTTGGQNFTLEDVAGDTIVNLKLGLRWNRRAHSTYVGYGRALTGDVWYRDIIRAEYGFRF